MSWVSVIIYQLVLAKFHDKNNLHPDLLILPAGGISRNPQEVWELYDKASGQPTLKEQPMGEAARGGGQPWAEQSGDRKTKILCVNHVKILHFCRVLHSEHKSVSQRESLLANLLLLTQASFNGEDPFPPPSRHTQNWRGLTSILRLI